jgi:hypothetical protein
MTDIAVDPNGNPSERLLVIAPNRLEFLRWCQENKIDWQAPNIKYVYNLHQLQGVSHTAFIDLGYNPHASNRDAFYEQLEVLVKTRGLRRVKVDDGRDTP